MLIHYLKMSQGMNSLPTSLPGDQKQSGEEPKEKKLYDTFTVGNISRYF